MKESRQHCSPAVLYSVLDCLDSHLLGAGVCPFEALNLPDATG